MNKYLFDKIKLIIFVVNSNSNLTLINLDVLSKREVVTTNQYHISLILQQQQQQQQQQQP
jgi:hypothetical protein